LADRSGCLCGCLLFSHVLVPAPLTAEWKRRLQPAPGDILIKLTMTPDFAVGPLRGIFEDLMVLERLREYVTTYDVTPNDGISCWRQLQKSNCDAKLVILCLDRVGFSSPAASPCQTPPSACTTAVYWSDLMFGHRGRVHVGPRLLR